MKAKSTSGQSIVELAMLIPAFCFCIMVIVQLMVLCHNELEMQRMVQASADRMASTTVDGSSFDSLFNRLWGTTTPPTTQRTAETITTWQHYRGISTVNAPGQLVDIDLKNYLLPNFLVARLGFTKQHATALALREPPIPEGE